MPSSSALRVFLALALALLGFLRSAQAASAEEICDESPFYLRLLPLGASITQGVSSSDGNGYRRPLRDQLRFDGWPVNMVGLKRDGSMVDSDNSGFAGFKVAEVHSQAIQGINAGIRPNVITINAGTNDCILNDDPGNAPHRMRDMILTLFQNIPDTTIILSTLLPNRDDNVYRCTQAVNRGYREIVRLWREGGYRIYLAEMDYNTDDAQLSGGFLTRDDLVGDGIHPNDYGYKKMAAVWRSAIQEALNAGAITRPYDGSQVGDWADDVACQDIRDPGLPRY